jgi:hypothetical protein
MNTAGGRSPYPPKARTYRARRNMSPARRSGQRCAAKASWMQWAVRIWRRLCTKLLPLDYDLLELTYLHEYRDQEIAIRLQISVTAVRVRRHRLLVRLRRIMRHRE